MVTKDKNKNIQYVSKSRDKKIQEIGINAYRKLMSQKQREYRARQRQNKAINEAVIKIQSAIRNKNAINEFATIYVDKYYRRSF